MNKIILPLAIGTALLSACPQKTPVKADAPKAVANTVKKGAPASNTASPKKAEAPKVDMKALETPADVKAPPADAQKTASGLASKVLTKGTGTEHPNAWDKVKVHYTGWKSSDGKMFDSSVKRGRPIDFPLNRVIKGWTEGVQLMVKGEKRRFWIPADLAYGDSPRGGAPSGQLVFDVELLEVISQPKPPPPPETPSDVAAPPKDAKKTASGLAYKVLKAGSGEKPAATSRVRVHYSGWTTDGKMFDSSVARGKPAEFPLNGVIKGWTEGVQLMAKGEKTRFWIPAGLAYGESPRAGAPKGQLTFDIELLEILSK